MISPDKEEPQHEWDMLSDYCIHCGIAAIHYVEEQTPCYRDKKVTAISHIRCKQVMGTILDVVRTAFKNHNSSSD